MPAVMSDPIECRTCGREFRAEALCPDCTRWVEDIGKEGCPVCHGEGHLHGWPDYDEPPCDATYTCPVCDGHRIVRDSLAQWARKQARKARENVGQLEALLREARLYVEDSAIIAKIDAALGGDR